MSDALLNTFIRYGSNADRLAFTPSPPSVSGATVKVLYVWYETDTDTVWAYTTGWHQITGSGTGGIDQLTGDVTAGPGTGSVAATIAANAVTTTTINNAAVTLAKIANAAANSVLLGSGAAGSGSAYTELTATQVTALLNAMVGDSGAGGTKGEVPAPAAGDAAAGRFLKADGTWAVPAGSAASRAITFAIDGGGSALTTGVKADVYVPYACTITAVTLLADQAGSVVVDIWKAAYASYPPTVADTITASAKPTLSAADHSTDSTLTGWTVSVSAGDTLRFNIDSAATLQRLNLTLTVSI